MEGTKGLVLPADGVPGAVTMSPADREAWRQWAAAADPQLRDAFIEGMRRRDPLEHTIQATLDRLGRDGLKIILTEGCDDDA